MTVTTSFVWGWNNPSDDTAHAVAGNQEQDVARAADDAAGAVRPGRHQNAFWTTVSGTSASWRLGNNSATATAAPAAALRPAPPSRSPGRQHRRAGHRGWSSLGMAALLVVAARPRRRPVGRVPMKVLAIGAHPDDIELGCARRARPHVAAGDEVTMLVMTAGGARPAGPDLPRPGAGGRRRGASAPGSCGARSTTGRSRPAGRSSTSSTPSCASSAPSDLHPRPARHAPGPRRDLARPRWPPAAGSSACSSTSRPRRRRSTRRSSSTSSATLADKLAALRAHWSQVMQCPMVDLEDGRGRRPLLGPAGPDLVTPRPSRRLGSSGTSAAPRGRSPRRAATSPPTPSTRRLQAGGPAPVSTGRPSDAALGVDERARSRRDRRAVDLPVPRWRRARCSSRVARRRHRRSWSPPWW